MKQVAFLLTLAVSCASTGAWAGDAAIGRRLAESRCAPCHAVGAWKGDEQADAPPFVVIARKFPPDSGSLIVALRGPHHKMNFRPSQKEADDIAEYMRTLVR